MMKERINKMEIRSNSYRNKASILHIDRRKEFKHKLKHKLQAKTDAMLKNRMAYDEKF